MDKTIEKTLEGYVKRTLEAQQRLKFTPCGACLDLYCTKVEHRDDLPKRLYLAGCDGVSATYTTTPQPEDETSRAFGSGRRPNEGGRGEGGSPVSTPVTAQEVTDDSKYWTQPTYSKLGVKGNFLPLAAQPEYVELADWLAHKCSEDYKLLESFIMTLQERNKPPNGQVMQICNPACCPSMSAGKNYTYTWLNSAKEPVKVPAIQYISLVQRWIVGKLSDQRVFPHDPLTGTAATYASGNVDNTEAPIAAGPTTLDASVAELSGKNWVGKDTGFPENFVTDVKTIFRQMFRIYAHIYHSHFVHPFWHLSGSSDKSGWPDLNSAFANFIVTAKLFCLLSEKDMEPMQRLIDIWAANGTIPKEALNGTGDVNALQAKLRSQIPGAPAISTTVPMPPTAQPKEFADPTK